MEEKAQGTRKRAFLLLFCVAIAYGSMFRPSTVVREAVLDWLGQPKYVGFIGVMLPHMFLYTTLAAVVSSVLWWLLNRSGMMPPLSLRADRRTLGEALIGAIVSVAVLFATAVFLGAKPAWLGLNGWSIAGNIFSNFYEELVFRGFIFTALAVVFGKWPAMILSSVMWAGPHAQYAWPMRGAIACVGVLYCWVKVRARSLLAPYGAHMVMDVVLDSILG